MRFVGDDEIEVGRREQLLVLVVEQQGLHGGDDNLGAPPVVPVLFVDHRLKVGGEHGGEGFLGLVLQLKAIDEEQHAAHVAGTQKQLDHGGGGEGLAGAGGHLEQETVFAIADCGLKAVDGLELIGPEKTQLVGLDVAGAFRFVLPGGFGCVVRALGANDVVRADLLFDQSLRIGRELLVTSDRVRCRKRGDDVGIAAFEIPEVVQVAVGKNDEATVLRLGVFARLLFADEWIFVFGLGFENKQRKAFGIEQEKVDKAFCALFEVGAERVQVGGLDRDAGFKANVGGAAAIRKKAPACCFEQLVDFDAGGGFLVGHSESYASDGGLAASMATIGGRSSSVPFWPTTADQHITLTATAHCGQSSGMPSTAAAADQPSYDSVRRNDCSRSILMNRFLLEAPHNGAA